MTASESPRTENRSLADEAYHIIRERLVAREFASGAVLTARGLATELSMSRTPVREALERLALTGMLESGSGGRFRPARLRMRDVRDLYDLRELLECEAAGLVADKQRNGELEVAALAGAPGNDLPTSLADLIAPSNPLLASLIENVQHRLEHVTPAALRPTHPQAPSSDVMTSIRAGDRQAAQNKTREQIRQARVAALAEIRQ